MTQARAQALLSVPAEPPLVIGIPAVLRTARSLRAAEVREVLLFTESGLFATRWGRLAARLRCREVAAYDGARPIREQLDGGAPAVVLAPDGMPDEAALAGFLAEARRRPRPSSWIWNGRIVAAYYPMARALLEGLPEGSREFPRGALAPRGAAGVEADPEAWMPLDGAQSLALAERRAFDALRQDTDGYLARLDRTLSIWLSSRLVLTPVTPNQITTLSLAVGLAGSGLLAFGGYWAALAGAVLLWSCCVLDGCDGEVARLKLLSSEAGARYDVLADNAVHLSVFAAIPLRVHRARPDLALWKPAAGLLAGVAACMLAVWLLILRQPEDRRARLERVLERIASRDFLYLVLALAAIDRLEWFLYGAAVGANLFWLAVCWICLLHRGLAARGPDGAYAARGGELR